MDNNLLDNIVDNILSIKPLLFKNLIKPDILNKLIPSGTHYLLALLEKRNSLTMSEIGRELCMPKPNVTTLVDKLIKDKLVKRVSDERDRRKINIKLTKQGELSIQKARSFLIVYIKDKLTVLNDRELNKLSVYLQNVKEILSKI